MSLCHILCYIGGVCFGVTGMVLWEHRENVQLTLIHYMYETGLQKHPNPLKTFEMKHDIVKKRQDGVKKN